MRTLDEDSALEEIEEALGCILTTKVCDEQLSMEEEKLVSNFVISKAKSCIKQYHAQHRHIAKEPINSVPVRKEINWMTERFLACPTYKVPHTPTSVCVNFIRRLAMERLSGLDFIPLQQQPATIGSKLAKEVSAFVLIKHAEENLPLPHLMVVYKAHKESFRWITNTTGTILSPAADVYTCLLKFLATDVQTLCAEKSDAIFAEHEVRPNYWWPIASNGEFVVGTRPSALECIFIKNFAEKTEQLRKLVRKDQEWEWDEKQEGVVSGLKREFREGGLVLGVSDFEATPKHHFIEETDAGPTALGDILIHADVNGEERSLRFESRTLNGTERNYSQFKRETLAVLHCLTVFRNYLFGRRFVLRVDPTALTDSLKNYAPSDPTIARWLAYSGEGANEDIPLVDAFLDEEEDVKLHINAHAIGVEVIVQGQSAFLAPAGYVKRTDIVLKDFVEEDPWGGKEVEWMAKLALTETFQLGEDPLAIESEAYSLDTHESCHRAFALTYAKARELYYWEGMSEMIRKYCESCISCQIRASTMYKESLHSRIVRDAGAVVHLDLLAMPQGVGGYNYTFDTRNNLTGFVDGRAIRSKTGECEPYCKIRQVWILQLDFAQMTKRVWGTGSYEERVAQIVRESLDWRQFARRMLRLRPQPIDRQGRPMRFDGANLDEFHEAFIIFGDGQRWTEAQRVRQVRHLVVPDLRHEVSTMSHTAQTWAELIATLREDFTVDRRRGLRREVGYYIPELRIRPRAQLERDEGDEGRSRERRRESGQPDIPRRPRTGRRRGRQDRRDGLEERDHVLTVDIGRNLSTDDVGEETLSVGSQRQSVLSTPEIGTVPVPETCPAEIGVRDRGAPETDQTTPPTPIRDGEEASLLLVLMIVSARPTETDTMEGVVPDTASERPYRWRDTRDMALDLPQRELSLMIGPTTIGPMQEHEEPQPEWPRETTLMHDELGHEGQRTLEEAEAVLKIQEREASDWRAQVQRVLREYEPPADATDRDRLRRRVVLETVRSSQLESQVSTLVRLRQETEEQTQRLFYEDAATAGWQEEVRMRRRTGEEPMLEGERMMEHVKRITQTEVTRGEVLQDVVQRIGSLEQENRGLRDMVRNLVTSAEQARQSTSRLEQRITDLEEGQRRQATTDLVDERRTERQQTSIGQAHVSHEVEPRGVRLDIPHRDSQTKESLGGIGMTCEEAAVVDKLMLEPDEIERRREAEARGLDRVPPSELAVQGDVWREMGGRHDERERISEPRDVMPQQDTSESATLLPMTLPFTPAPAFGAMDEIVHLLSSGSERCDEEATTERVSRMLSPYTVDRAVQDVTIRLERARPQILPKPKKAKVEDNSAGELCSWCGRGVHDRVGCPAFQDDLNRRVVQFDGQGRVRDMHGALLPRRRHDARRALYDRLGLELREDE
ncbi:hypothetical protein CBR_g19778 [Chara braunii]|uniref:Reverse transcriptase RNase H-like domain-containing protein n=1 Tax=Chara braunii TaxID=69332 RepID=A0A388JTW0_CHABU|nr:hypothetical protein CBR_g19778 [Chara braunii]|eukprot:GBG61246.1 hypothetical protein CBR_g19778 [Chara braunii]